MKFIRNKFIIGLMCIAIGITAGFVLLPKSQEAEITMTRVVRLKQDIKAGTHLKQAMLETVAIPTTSVPGGAASAPESFLSRYAVTQLFAGDILTTSKVRDTLVDPVAAGAAKGKQLVSVTVPSVSAGVSGTLKPGDVVAVMVTSKVTQTSQQLGLLASPGQYTTVSAEEGGDEVQDEAGAGQPLLSSIRGESQTTIPEILRYLEVCKITASDGTDALVNAVKDPEQANRLPAAITFYATEEQALKLAEVEQNGEIHIALLARGDDADVFIPRSERVLVEEEAPRATAQPESLTPAVTDVPAMPTAADNQITKSPAPEPIGTEPASTMTPTARPSPALIDLNDPEVGE